MTDQALIEAALAARQHAYVPYSHYAVGAALIAGSGALYTGCNIESAAYSPSNCAERTAIFKAVSEGERELKTIAIVAGREERQAPLPAFAAPCGVCRQVMAEFAADDLRIL
ncbi:MAG: cytidine deaminase, partial [Oscillospiraceae bacterium]